jgi:exonuclease III
VDHGGDGQQERMMRVELLSLGIAAALMSTSASAEIRVASWNLNNLHHQLDEPLRPGAPARTQADIEILRKYRDRTNADIFALQEVNGPRAAQLVFPADQWDLFFSGRYADDLVTGRESDRTTLASRSGAVCLTRSASETSRSLACGIPMADRSAGALKSWSRRAATCCG